MNQEERLVYLIDELCKETIEYQDLQIGQEERRMIFRSLRNIRPPKPISEKFLQIQDEFLQQEIQEKGIITLEQIPTIKEQYNSKHSYAERISIWQGDITRLKVDGIVNAANSQMLGCFIPCHKCIDNAIHSAAGIKLREECAEIMKRQGHEEQTGKAKITKAYNLPCRYILHTVGPIVQGKLKERDCELLKSCYKSCLELAEENQLESIAFCCISTGEFHFPNQKASQIAVETVEEWLKHSSLKRVIFNVFKNYDLELYKKILNFVIHETNILL